MRPSGGSRPSQPRRGQPAKQQRTKQPQRPTKGAPKQKTPEQKRREAEQQRRVIEQQQRAAKAKTAKDLQQRSQLHYMRETAAANRERDAERRTTELRLRVEELESILATGLRRSPRIDLDALLQTPVLPGFDPGPLATPLPKPSQEDFRPAGLPALWGGKAGKERREAAAEEEFARAWEAWERDEAERQERLAEAERRYDERLAATREAAGDYNSRIARIGSGLRDRSRAEVESFLRTVLRRTPLPEGFPRQADVTYFADQEWVVVRMVLPGADIIPEIESYEFLAAPGDIRPVPRSPEETAQLYRLVLAQVALLVIRDFLEADRELARVTFHGLVDAAEPACLISATAERAEFEALDLEGASPLECLSSLRVMESPDPVGYAPAVASAS